MPHLILRVHDKAVNPRLATFHLLITQPAGSQSPKLSSAVAAPPAATAPAATTPAATPPAAPVVVGLIRFTGDVTRESSMAMEDKVGALKKAAGITTFVILIDSGGGASAEGESLAALLLQRSLRNVKILAYVVNQACSAAYQEIYCCKSASIGPHFYDFKKALVTSGKRKAGNPLKENKRPNHPPREIPQLKVYTA